MSRAGEFAGRAEGQGRGAEAVRTGWPHGGHAERRPDPVLIAALVLDTALAIVDAVTTQVVMINLLIFGPLVAAPRVGPRSTAFVAAYGLLLAVLEGFPHHIFGTPDHLVRCAAVASTGALAVYGSWLRERHALAERRAALLARVGALLGSSPDVEDALRGVARLVVPAAADWCAIDLADADGALRRCGAADTDPAREEALRGGEALPLAEVRTAVRGGEPLMLPDAAIMPLCARERIAGALTLGWTRGAPAAGTPELQFAGELAAECANAVDSARLHLELRRSEDALRRSSDQLGAILGGVADGVLARDSSGLVVYANDAAAEILSRPSAEELRQTPLAEALRPLHVFTEEGRELRPDELPGGRVLRGEPAPDRLLRFEAVRTGVQRWVRVKARPVRSTAGELRLVIVIFEDVTDRHRREHGERLLAESSRALAASLDYEATLRTISRLAVPAFADVCSVDIAAPGGLIRNVATTYAEPGEGRRRAQQLHRRGAATPSRRGAVAEVLGSGRPALHAPLAGDGAGGASDGLDLLRELGMASAMVVPMSARGRTLGAMTLAVGPSGRRFDDDDLALAEELARRCALAIDNARLYGERSHVARTLQRSLVPVRLPRVPGFEVAARFHAVGEASEVGGDFFDLFEADDGGWAAVIGDVSGKGAEAAAVTALARYTVRAVAAHGSRPSSVLQELNDAMLRHELDDRFCTAVFARLRETADGARAQVAVGGHPLPLVVRADGAVDEVGFPGTALGIGPAPRLRDVDVDLRPGDQLVLVTDGVVEAQVAGRMLGADGLRALLCECAGRDAVATAQRIERAVIGDGEPRDDVAVLVLRAAGAAVARGREGLARSGAMGRERALSLRLAGGPHAPAVAREALEAMVADALDAPTAHAARLLTSEVVTNSVRHGAAGAQEWIGFEAALSPSALRVEVTDHGPGFVPAPARPGPDDDGGRGLYLVDRLADRWGSGAGGTHVWFELDRPVREAAG